MTESHTLHATTHFLISLTIKEGSITLRAESGMPVISLTYYGKEDYTDQKYEFAVNGNSKRFDYFGAFDGLHYLLTRGYAMARK